MKMYGVIMVICAYGALGLLVAQNYNRRPRIIEQIKMIFSLLETEITYSLTPAPMALKVIASKADTRSHLFFYDVATEMEDSGVTLSAAWQNALRQFQENTVIGNEEVEILAHFGNQFGQADLYQQQKQFQTLQNQLDLIHEQSLLEKQNKQKVFQYMGFCIGIAICLILF